ncbi:MAG: (2Fe-2S)-binding protein [Candidatus Pacebacteria bacterium]|nr:(2Fe-2S)-binding protein [Candidatus Paceibacterota bacterium]
MSETITFTIDGVEVQGAPGQTILEAADAAGVYIPRLCKGEGLAPRTSCRVCTVMVNGRPQTACSYPISDGMVVENETEELMTFRKNIIDMLFIEGNHYCMFCEASGRCELQALAYRFGINAPKYPFMYPKRELDTSHPDVYIERNRCILCGRCVNASRDEDGKGIFEFIGRGSEKKIAVDSSRGLSGTDAAAADKAVEACPVGSLLPKHRGYDIPVGRRAYDAAPIGSDIERHRKERNNE